MGTLRALVIGATGGIGREIARVLAEPGLEIVVHGHVYDERVDRLLDDIRSRGASAHAVIRTIECAEDIIEEIDALLPVDILVVSFGPMIRAPVVETDTEAWRRMAELNLVMPSAAVGRCLPAMKERNFGRILLFGGTRTDRIRGFETIAAYAAAKTGLGTVVKSVARQTRSYDICINALCPGYVDTEYYDDADRARAVRAAPGGRMIDPTEVAETAGVLLNRRNKSMTGAIVPIDGGLG
ncbi:MAG: SDR family NAD(P)-dependent oxidoreductase [Spirochaetaceae bacterium]